MLTVAQSSGATIGTARRGVWRGGLPHSSGTFLRGRFFGYTHIRRGRDGIFTFLEDVQAEAAWRGPGACRGTAGRSFAEGTQPGARAGARRRHHAAGRGQQYLPVADDSAADVAIATTGPSDPGLPEAAAAAPKEGPCEE